jgi:hypothetical protein
MGGKEPLPGQLIRLGKINDAKTGSAFRAGIVRQMPDPQSGRGFDHEAAVGASQKCHLIGLSRDAESRAVSVCHGAGT